MREGKQHRLLDLFAWTVPGRVVVFALAATSILCLLADFYGVCSMRLFTWAILLPACAALGFLAIADRRWGDGQLWRSMLVGGIAGFVAACAYDLFRLPFVFSNQWRLAGVVPAMNLFKVFPRFGAMILGDAAAGPEFSLAEHLIGWAYHFSNGVTFGIMYVAMLGQIARRSWLWAIAMAVGIELAMLATPYTARFEIPLTMTFIAVTLSAHVVFGLVLGLASRRLERRWPLDAASW